MKRRKHIVKKHRTKTTIKVVYRDLSGRFTKKSRKPIVRSLVSSSGSIFKNLFPNLHKVVVKKEVVKTKSKKFFRNLRGRFAKKVSRKKSISKKIPFKVPGEKTKKILRKKPIRKKIPLRVPRKKTKKILRKKSIRKKIPLRVPRKKTKKILRKKPVRKKIPLRVPRKKTKKKKKPFRLQKFPSWMGRSIQSETMIQEFLTRFMNQVSDKAPDFIVGLKSFVNVDGTVDGEVRLGNLPDQWRSYRGLPLLITFLSTVIQSVVPLPAVPDIGGKFWASFGVRFGPSNDDEIAELAKLYKRYRGLYQVSAYYTPAWHRAALLNNAAAIREMTGRTIRKRGLPPVQIFLRITWTPDGVRPDRYEGEKGKDFE